MVEFFKQLIKEYFWEVIALLFLTLGTVVGISIRNFPRGYFDNVVSYCLTGIALVLIWSVARYFFSKYYEINRRGKE